MEVILFDKDLKDIQENIEKYAQTFLNMKENTDFITNDGIKFKMEAIYLKSIKLIFEKNDLNLVSILLTKFNYGFIYNKVFEIGDNFYKSIAKSKYIERKFENYYRVSFYRKDTEYFNPNGPVEIFYKENGEIEHETYCLFGKVVNEKKYNDFISKLKSGCIEKNINKYKNLDKVKEICEYAKFHSLNELVEKCNMIMVTKKLSGK